MSAPRLVVVTATTDADRFEEFATRLVGAALNKRVPIVAYVQRSEAWLEIKAGIVERSPDYTGVIPAFAEACAIALRAYPSAEVIACLHDDLLMNEPRWDEQLLDHFDQHPNCGLAGFGGAWGLGDADAGQGDYRPTWLVRRGFMSNMQDAEAHGTRVTEARKVACLDGFSQVFRRKLLVGEPALGHRPVYRPDLIARGVTLFGLLQSWGVMHHAYDAATGAFAKQLGWDTWLLPFACHHLGGQTAVGDAGYNEWARRQAPGRPESEHMVAGTSGDQLFWEQAHKIIWNHLGYLLPFEVDRP